MEFFRIKKDIPFMRHALVLNAISLITFLAAVFFLWHNGLHLSIEFTGGTVIEVQYEQTADLENIRNSMAIEFLIFSKSAVCSYCTSITVPPVNSIERFNPL